MSAWREKALIPAGTTLEREAVEKVAVIIAGASADAGEARELLEACGIARTPRPGRRRAERGQ